LPITYIHKIPDYLAYLIVFLFFFNISFLFLQGPILIFLENIFIETLLWN
jgi:hypothetical protein